MSDNHSLLLVLWVLWLATALQLAAAAHGWLVERREGLKLSWFRLSAALVLFGATTALSLVTTLLPEAEQQQPAPASAPAQPAATPTDDPEVRAINLEIEAALKEIAKIDEQKKPFEQKIADLRRRLPQPPPPASSPTPPPAEKGWLSSIPRQKLILAAIAITALLLLAGFAVLLMGGEIRTLFPEGWSLSRRRAGDGADLKKELDRLTSVVWQKDYERGLAIAQRMPEKRLAHFDRLDYLFLRAYCAVHLMSGEEAEGGGEERSRLREAAIKDLESVVEEAPKRGEALYLLGLAYGLAGRNAEALAMFDQSQEILARHDLPFDHNQSVCLLKLAELSLSENNIEQAEKYFRRVTTLGKLAGSVVESRIRIGINDLRSAINKKEMEAASSAIRKLEGLSGLRQEHKLQLEAIQAAFSARVALRTGDASQALEQAKRFLEKHLPANLPRPDEEVADETLGLFILEDELPFPREVFRGFLFIQAVALCKLEAQPRAKLSEAQVAKLSEPLLRGLQFDPRHRELLGALGGLYYWFRKDKRQKALDWLEAAAMMGVSGRIVHKILERDRIIEMERREALDWFRSASARFLRDPTLAGEVRHALVEELGRFQEFEPLLISLQQRPELEPEEPTLEEIKERAAYLAQLVADAARKGQSDRHARLAQIRAEYSACLETLERTTENITTLEQRIFAELCDALAL
jgi:tetratricopeptide (TPR) repeat protein